MNREKLLKALNIKFNSDAGDNITIRDYLYRLLFILWEEGENFNGKRPFGNSGWDFELFKPLIEHGMIKGSLDEYGYIHKIDEEEGYKFVSDLIYFIFYKI